MPFKKGERCKNWKGFKSGSLNEAKKPEVRQKISEKLIGRRLTNEHCANIAKGHIGLKHPHHKETRKNHSIYMKNYWKEHPEKHPNRIMGENKMKGTNSYISYPQTKLFKIFKLLYGNEVQLEYPVILNNRRRFLDIVIPSIKLNIEYDGEHWHKNKENDCIRDNLLKELGWNVVRFDKKSLSELDKFLNIPQFIWQQN